jgi:hypothetical protein
MFWPGQHSMGKVTSEYIRGIKLRNHTEVFLQAEGNDKSPSRANR